MTMPVQDSIGGHSCMQREESSALGSYPTAIIIFTYIYNI